MVEAVPEVVPPDIGFLFPDESFFRKCVLLIDGTSPLPGREKHQAECFDDIQRHGMRAATCADDRG